MGNREKNKKSGSVLVIGGGIAGIQSSLDLADSGFKVYLLENTPAIGGVMAQLDKTFPTNDCAMCIISPKLVECGRHLNIDLMTNSELREVTGKAGNFKIKIYQHPRFVDLDKCTGCGECEKVCPVTVMSVFDEGLVGRKAIYKPYAQASPNAFVIDKRETAPCQIACPASIHVQGYVALARDGKYKEAYDLIRENNPFPSICGRVCHHPCEPKCRRGDYDDPVAIMSIKRYIADYVLAHQQEFEEEVPQIEKKEEKVAIIGGGPAGLTCAYYLTKLGYPVTVFEKEAKPGGMMRMGIPAYRLARENLDWEIEQILKAGIELKTNFPITSKKDIERLKKEGFKSIYIGVGFQKAKQLDIEGADLPGVLLGIDFLKEVNLENDVKVGKKVVVIGGGNVAVDVAKVALRLGANVDLACLECSREMPAHEWEIREAIEDGVRVHPSWGPKRIVGKNGKVSGIEFIKCTSVFDSEGRFNPCFDNEVDKSLQCDQIIIAIGQGSDLSFLEGTGVEVSRAGTVSVDPVTFATDVKGIFSGGDIVKGPASVVEAVGQAYEAAISIDRYLRGEDIAEGRTAKSETLPAKEERDFVKEEKRVRMPTISPEKRIRNFKEFETGYSEEEVWREASRCLECGLCSGCLQCEVACEADAVIHSMLGQTVEIDVGSIIVATGADKFDPTAMHEYGYGRYMNVLTSIQFERILAASGPYEGHLQRPHDGKVPKKIAWIQCVGSRTEDMHMPYCSSVCCMYTIKEAIIAKEHVNTVEPTIFFMDMRAYGKDFDKYYERAKEMGVRFIRARVGKVKEISETGNLEVYYVKENGDFQIEEFEMVVLSVGLKPPDNIRGLSDRLGIRLNPYHFIDHLGQMPIQTSRPGIFVCGPAVSPKDIPETVIQASGAVAGAAEILAEARGTEIARKVYPVERDVSGQTPRIGVFVCHCGINIGSIVDVPATVEYVKTLPNVVYAEANLFTCSQDTQLKMKAVIEEYKLNRVVVASCSPSTHEPLFQETLRETGLNPYLFDMANIRNQCSWVHRDDKKKATEKAQTLTRIAIGKARLLEPLHTVSLEVTQKGLVVGGGLAGMTAALSIAEQGFEVALIERNEKLGGNLNRLKMTIDGKNVSEYLKSLTEEIEAHPLVKVYKNSKISEIQGYIGNYITSIKINGSNKTEEYEHGIVVIATGGQETQPEEYLYDGQNGKILTQFELEKDLEENLKQYKKIKNVVMIQCVGSRDDEHPYCSRVCCAQAIKNGIRLKKMNPKMNIYILYRDIRTYGLLEQYYQEARALGIIFIRYDEHEKPVVKTEEKDEKQILSVSVKDHVLGVQTVIHPDKIILAPAMVPQDDAFDLSQKLKIPLNEENFFMEAHVKLRPVDFSAEGIFLAGLAHSPKMMDETISQAKAAAERACSIISSNEYISEANISSVDMDVCAGCGICVEVCPYGAPGLIYRNGRVVCHVNTALCKGCGSCVSVCPSGAMQQLGYKEEQTLAMVHEALY